MKLKATLTLLTLLLVSACSSGGIRDQKVTDSNQKEILNEAMQQLSTEEKKTLLAYILRNSMNNMGDEMANLLSNKKDASKSQWGSLPKDKSINEMLADQKAFEAKQN